MQAQFHNLQALRGVACLLVVAYHLSQLEAGYGLGFNPLKAFRWFGFAGVDLFFVLSGFIITTTSRPDLGRLSRLPRYLFRRAWRIYPTFWAALSVSVAASVVLSHESLVRPGWVAEVFETVLLIPPSAPQRLLPVAWTLSYELMFYAVFAALFVLPRWAAIPALLGWAALVLRAYITSTYPGNRFAAIPLSPFVLEFLFGALVAWCPARLSGRWAGVLALAGMIWSAAWLTVRSDPHPDRLAVEHFSRAVVFGVPAALFVFAMTGWERTGGRLRPRWLESVGDASYSVYLLHLSCMLAAMLLTVELHWSHRKFAHAGWVVFMFAGTILPGMLFHRFIERPLLDLVKTRRAPVPPAETVIPPVPARKAA
jgi:peptidoglycan/LPS O-acetylase OafA/YrhL